MSHEIVRERALTVLVGVICLALGLIIGSGCGIARAGGGVQILLGPAGYTCFGISDGERIVGGNCVRD